MRLKRSILLFAITVLIATFVLAAPVLAAPPANDEPANAIAVTSLPYENTQSTIDATGTTGEPESYSCGFTPENLVWYQLTAPETGIVYTHTFGSDFNTVIYMVENGYCNDDLSLIYEGDESGLAFAVTAGNTYTIGFGGRSGGSGNSGNLSVKMNTIAPVANDNPANAIAVDTFPYTNTQTTYGAADNTDEALFVCAGGATRNGTPVWYSVTVPVNGVLRLDTTGSNFDTAMVVVERDLCDDDGASPGDFNESFIEVGVVAGTYTVGIAGYQGEQGNLKFRADFIAPQRIYPFDENIISTTIGGSWSKFAFNAADGIEWYKVWIGSADYQTTHLSQWYKAIDICDGSVCTIPQDLWLENGDYVWWMTYWGPSAQNYGGYWNATTFSIDFGAIDPITNRMPTGTVILRPSELTWDHDPDALWYHLWLGTDDYQTTYQIAWYKASDICAGGVCAVPIDVTVDANVGYEWWMEAWGPGEYDAWSVNGAAAFTYEPPIIIIGPPDQP